MGRLVRGMASGAGEHLPVPGKVFRQTRHGPGVRRRAVAGMDRLVALPAKRVPGPHKEFRRRTRVWIVAIGAFAGPER